MKHVLTLCATFLLTVSAFANGVEINGLYYRFNGENAIVTYTGRNSSDFSTYTGDIVIPSQVENGGITYTVTEIDEYAFYYASITSVVFPNTLTTIGSRAFDNCPIDTLRIPASVTSIGVWAFVQCPFVFISVDESNPVYDSRDNCNAIIRTETNELLLLCPTSSIPDAVTMGYGCCFASGDYPEMDDMRYADTYLLGVADYEKTQYRIKADTRWIADTIFWSCPNVQKVICEAVTPPQLSSYLGLDAVLPFSVPVYVPMESVDLYLSDPQWSEYNINGMVVEQYAPTRDTMQLSWLPVPSAANYVLTITSITASDTVTNSISLLADGSEGHVTSLGSAPSRRVVLDDIGSLVVIALDPNSGVDASGTIRVDVSTSSEEELFCLFNLNVFDVQKQQISSEEGHFVLNDPISFPQDIVSLEYTATKTPILGVDMFGRCYSIENWDSLPSGIYILWDGEHTTKVLK